ncbi:hypothetical protein LINPERHAP2_LOCUS6196 [Linum perenne]
MQKEVSAVSEPRKPLADVSNEIPATRSAKSRFDTVQMDGENIPGLVNIPVLYDNLTFQGVGTTSKVSKEKKQSPKRDKGTAKSGHPSLADKNEKKDGKQLLEFGPDCYEEHLPAVLSSSPVEPRGLSKEWGTMLLGARSSIRNGRDTPFWTTRWVDSGIRLIDSMAGTDVDFNPLDTVADFVNEDGQWNFEEITRLLSSDVAEAVFGMTPPIVEGEDDQWVGGWW